MRWRESERSPITDGTMGRKARYKEIRPDDGSGKLKKGDRWTYYVIRRTMVVKTGTRYERLHLYLSKIEKTKDDGGSTCRTWSMEKEKSLKFKRLPAARAEAEAGGGEPILVMRIYGRGKQAAEEAAT